jgi:outer membrane protein TolC
MLSVISIFICINLPIFGQDVHVLDLQDCLGIATEKNFQMRTLQENLLVSQFRLQSATNRFKTRIDLSLTVPSFTETIRRFEDSLGVYYTPIKQVNYSSRLEISQPLPTDGRLFMSTGIYSLEDYEVDRNTVELITRFGFVQPLEAFYSYNRLQSNFEIAELNYELSQKQLTRAELDIRYNVSNAFYGLVSALEREKIANQTLQAQRESNELAQSKYQAGVIAEVEALQMEVDLAGEMNNYDISMVNRIAEENLLKQLLEIPLNDSIMIETDLGYKIVDVDLEKAITFGMKHRLEIREKEIENQLAEIDIRRIRVEGQITGNIFAYYDLIGIGNDPRNIGLNETFRNAWWELRHRRGNKGILLNISIPIWDWGVSWADVQAAKAISRQTNIAIDNEKVQVEREIRNTVAILQSSLRRLQLLEKNIELAQKSFDISVQRFARGEIDTQALAFDRLRHSNAYVSHLDAYISYKLNLIDIARKTFYDFEKDTSLITE